MRIPLLSCKAVQYDLLLVQLSNKKAELPMILPSATRPSSTLQIRPAAFRPLLSKGLALSKEKHSYILLKYTIYKLSKVVIDKYQEALKKIRRNRRD